MSPTLLALRKVDPGKYVVYLGFLLIIGVFGVVMRGDGFLSFENLLNIVQQTTPVTVMAVGTVFVLAAGEIDLSIGSTVALAALVTAVLLRDHATPLAVAGGLAVGAAVGFLNGWFVTRLRLPSFLVTLATMGLFAGVGRMLTDLQSVPVTNDLFNGLFGSGSLWGVPGLVIWSVAALTIGHIYFRHTRFGAHVLAIGDNASAARVSGIKVERYRIFVMVLSGLCAALAGILYCGRLQGARYTLGEADLMTVLAAVIIGGTRLNGGVGSVTGALVGSLIMGMLNNGLILMGLTVAQQMIVRGLIILIAVALTLREKQR